MRRQGVTTFLDAMAEPIHALAAFADICSVEGKLTARAHFALLDHAARGPRSQEGRRRRALALARRYDQGTDRAARAASPRAT